MLAGGSASSGGGGAGASGKGKLSKRHAASALPLSPLSHSPHSSIKHFTHLACANVEASQQIFANARSCELELLSGLRCFLRPSQHVSPTLTHSLACNTSAQTLEPQLHHSTRTRNCHAARAPLRTPRRGQNRRDLISSTMPQMQMQPSLCGGVIDAALGALSMANDCKCQLMSRLPRRDFGAALSLASA